MEGAFDQYIGVFDSGVGGISVLRSMTRELPEENFLYFGDSANAPYGDKTIEEVQKLSARLVSDMIDKGVKAVVIACNTATSAAARLLRDRFPDIPILGLEPAIRPAAREHPGQRILVMATDVTLRLEKFQRLSRELSEAADFIPVVCGGLAARIEQGNLGDRDVTELLEDLLGPYRGKADAVVLGCTHYPFVSRQIREVMGDLPLYDGADGTARELRRTLEKRKLLRNCPEGEKGHVTFLSSKDTDRELQFYRELFEEKL